MSSKKKSKSNKSATRWDDEIHGKVLIPYIQNGTLVADIEISVYRDQIYKKETVLQYQKAYDSKENAKKFLARYKEANHEGSRRGRSDLL